MCLDIGFLAKADQGGIPGLGGLAGGRNLAQRSGGSGIHSCYGFALIDCIDVDRTSTVNLRSFADNDGHGLPFVVGASPGFHIGLAGCDQGDAAHLVADAFRVCIAFGFNVYVALFGSDPHAFHHGADGIGAERVGN